MSKFLLPILLFAIPAMATVAESHGLDEHQIRTILYQCLNVGVLVIGLIFVLRKPTKEFFMNKQQQFLSAAQKAAEIKKLAEDQFKDIQARLQLLESTAESSVVRARSEAQDLKKSVIDEAHEASRRIKKEAENNAAIEIQKAKLELRKQMIDDAAEIVNNKMNKGLSGDEQKRLQSDFVDQVMTVTQ